MIERYLSELDRLLPRGVPRRARVLREVEDHLRDAARDVGPEAAVERFGPPDVVAARFTGAFAASWARLAVAAAAGALVLLPILYPVTENALPPAPWPEDAMPRALAWKQDAVLGLSAAAALATAVSAAGLRRAGWALLAPVGVAAAALCAGGILGLVLAVQWADYVPGTPGWLVGVPLLQLAGAAAAAAATARAAQLRPRD